MKVFKPRRGKRSTAISKSIVLQDGEIFFEVPSEGVGKGKGKIIMGDGIRSYEDLPVFLETGSSGGGGLAPSNATSISVGLGNSKLTIKWSDPGDTVIEDQTLCTWSGTKLVMKTSGYPSNEDDGTLIVDNTIRDQYKINGYEITGLTNDTTYYFQLFPYSDQDIVNRNTINRATGTPTSDINVTLTLNGANSDIITIKDSNNTTVGTCTFASGQTSGNITITIPANGGDYKFISTYAKDIETGTVAYEKTVTLTNNLTQTINVYDTRALLWYGNSIETLTASNVQLINTGYPRITPTITNIACETRISQTCISSSDTNIGGALFGRKFDLTNVTSIKWRMNTDGTRLYVAVTSDGLDGSFIICTGMFNQTHSLDVTSLSGEYYIGFQIEAPVPVGATIINGIEQLWLENEHENDYRIQGANQDNIVIKDSNDITIQTCAFSSGNTYYYIDKELLPPGTYTFTSYVAKDTVAGTANYVKEITITGDPDQVINVYPDHALYWYGNFINITKRYRGSGNYWTNYKFNGATENTNSFTINQTSGVAGTGFISNEKFDMRKCTAVKCIFQQTANNGNVHTGLFDTPHRDIVGTYCNYDDGYNNISKGVHTMTANFGNSGGGMGNVPEPNMYVGFEGWTGVGISSWTYTSTTWAVWLEFDDEINHLNDICINSAVNDTVIIKNTNNELVGSCILSGGKSFGYISKSLLVPGTYLFESSIAKDTTDLSKSYKQYVTIDENTKEVNFHPEGALYWYGYFINCTTYRSNMSTLQTAEELSRAWQDSYISIGTNSISTAVRSGYRHGIISNAKLNPPNHINAVLSCSSTNAGNGYSGIGYNPAQANTTQLQGEIDKSTYSDRIDIQTTHGEYWYQISYAIAAGIIKAFWYD